MTQYLVALPLSRGSKGFNHQTILVSAKDERDARALVRHLKPHSKIGDIKVINAPKETHERQHTPTIDCSAE